MDQVTLKTGYTADNQSKQGDEPETPKEQGKPDPPTTLSYKPSTHSFWALEPRMSTSG